MSDPNIELLADVARALGDLCEELVFVGGCATGLLVTDPAAPSVRATYDVDAIVAAVSLQEYHRLGRTLRERGFSQPLEEGEPPFRWMYAGMKLDVMPIDEKVLGFSNRWYESALVEARTVRLRTGLDIRLITAPYFLGTKLDAFEDRGRGDYLESHDLEDVLSVVDGRPEIIGEMARAPASLRKFVADVFARLTADAGFINALPGLVSDRDSSAVRVPIVLGRLEQIAGLSGEQ